MDVKLDIRSVHFELDDNLRKYVTKKIDKLEKYISAEARSSMHVEIYLKESNAQRVKLCECEAVVHLPKEIIRIKDATVNMYAAVDIVEEKLKQALKRYKDLHDIGRKERHLLSRSRMQF